MVRKRELTWKEKFAIKSLLFAINFLAALFYWCCIYIMGSSELESIIGFFAIFIILNQIAMFMTR